MSTQELVQKNFQLTSEVKRLRNELLTVKAERQFEDSLEVERIKAAYSELEKEVVKLRVENQNIFKNVVEEVHVSEEEISCGISEILASQLREEREKMQMLEQKYFDLRKELSTQSVSYASTSTGSPCYKTSSSFSVDTFSDVVVIQPEMTRMRRTIALAEVKQPVVSSRVEPVRIEKRKKMDESTHRLSKIARFKPS